MKTSDSRTSVKSALVFAGLLAIGLAAGAVQAQSSAANFYKGKTVTVWVGYTAGGGYGLSLVLRRTFTDTWAEW